MITVEIPYESPRQLQLTAGDGAFWRDSRWAILGIVIALATVGLYLGILVLADTRINFFALSLLGIATGVIGIRDRRSGFAVALIAIVLNLFLVIFGFWLLHEWTAVPPLVCP